MKCIAIYTFWHVYYREQWLSHTNVGGGFCVFCFVLQLLYLGCCTAILFPSVLVYGFVEKPSNLDPVS